MPLGKNLAELGRLGRVHILAHADLFYLPISP